MIRLLHKQCWAPLLIAVAAFACSGSRATAQLPWPDSGSFHPILAAGTLEPIRDETGDVSPENTDVASHGHYKNGTVGDMPSVYLGGDSQFVYFRWLLSGNPLEGSGANYAIDNRTSWVVLLDTNNDDVQDYAIAVSKSNRVRFLRGTAGTVIRESALAPIVKSGTPPVYMDNTDGIGYVRVIDLDMRTLEPDPTGPHQMHYLDVRLPREWLTEAGETLTRLRPFMGTSATDQHINKDMMIGNEVDFDAVNPTDLEGRIGAIYDTRDTAPASDAGEWANGETVQLTGNGWPAGAALSLSILAPGGGVVWSGNATANASGDVAALNAWMVDGAGGLYRVFVGINGGTATQYDTFTVPSPTAPALTLTKTAPASGNAGGPLDYTLTVANNGDGAAKNVVIDDPIPTGTTFRLGSISAPGFTVRYEIGGAFTATAPADAAQAAQVTALRFTYDSDLAPGAQAVATFGVTISPTLPVGSMVQNVASVSYTGGSGDPLPPADGGTTTIITAPALTVSKSAESRDRNGVPLGGTRGTATTGDILAYTITFANTGDAPAHDVVVVDTLPAGVALRVASVNSVLPAGLSAGVAFSNDGGATWSYTPAPDGAGVDPNVRAVRWTLSGPLADAAPDNTGMLSLQVVVLPGITSGSLVNMATASYSDGVGNSETSADTETTPVSAAGVSIEPAGAAAVKPGGTVSFAHTVRNLGILPDTANITVAAPGGCTVTLYLDVNGTGKLDAGDTPLTDTNGDGMVDTGEMVPGASLPLVASVQVAPDQTAAVYDITLTARSALDTTKSAGVTDRVTVYLGTGLKLVKYIGTPGTTAVTARPGETVAYGLTITNEGDREATVVVLKDTLSAFLRYVAGSARVNGAPVPTEPYDPATRMLTVPIGTVAPGASVTVTFEAVVK